MFALVIDWSEMLEVAGFYVGGGSIAAAAALAWVTRTERRHQRATRRDRRPGYLPTRDGRLVIGAMLVAVVGVYCLVRLADGPPWAALGFALVAGIVCICDEDARRWS